ncbi:MAG: chemotaxis response regulator protein-glutamate methylesterase [Kurthia sp.]|nr:chemotaxis response regulator protein-glutamate methylesterase [Candidatus Kurthia equi]
MKKLLVVDDSAFMRKLISEFFEGNSFIEVVGTARNGRDALAKIKLLNPDVLTMDVEMPEMNGLEALKQIMEEQPKPVVMLSSTTTSNAAITMEAIANGAVDFVAKPSGTISLDLDKIKEELIEKVKAAALVPISRLQKATAPPTRFKLAEQSPMKEQSPVKELLPMKERHPIDAMVDQSWRSHSRKLVVIGTSTGGPRALQEVLTTLPATIGAPILIVQHMPAGFTNSLAKRLNQLSDITVKEAENGDLLQPGVAYIAPGGSQMTVRKVGMSTSIYIDAEQPAVGGHKPAVDVLFESVAKITDVDRIAVIMTGMGSDGSKGIKALKESGNTRVISEAEESCVVYGMPKSAEKTGVVDRVVKLTNISQTIMSFIK